MNELTVAVVASTRAWRSELQAYVRNHVAGVRLVVLREPRALLDEDVDVVVIDDVASLLNKLTIRRLRQRGIAIIGVHEPDADDGAGARLLAELGVDVTIRADAGAEELLRQIGALGSAAAVQEQVREQLDALGPPGAPVAADGVAGAAGGDPGPGLIAVVGVTGEPAGVEVATVMANVLAGRGERVIVVDANEVAPTLARYLAFGLEPNLLSALDALRHGPGVGAGPLAVRSPAASGRLDWDAIVGLANTADWPQVRDADVVSLLDELRRGWDRVVVVAGPHTEELEGLGPGRFGATRASLGAADAVIGVAPATRLGVLAWLDWAGDVADLLGPRPVWAALRRVPRSPFRRAELAQSVTANIAPAQLAGLVFLPEDPRLEDAAWQATPLRRGPFVKEVGGLVSALAPPRRSGRGARRAASREPAAAPRGRSREAVGG